MIKNILVQIIQLYSIKCVGIMTLHHQLTHVVCPLKIKKKEKKQGY